MRNFTEPSNMRGREERREKGREQGCDGQQGEWRESGRFSVIMHSWEKQRKVVCHQIVSTEKETSARVRQFLATPLIL